MWFGSAPRHCIQGKSARKSSGVTQSSERDLKQLNLAPPASQLGRGFEWFVPSGVLCLGVALN